MADQHEVPETQTPEADRRLAESREDLAEAKAAAAELAETTPDPFPDAEAADSGTPAS